MENEGARTGNRTVVVGAGVAGLTLAERLLASGSGGTVTVLEREDHPGGLGRTFSRDGFLFDIGPHRFHTSDPAVQSYLLEVLGDDFITMPRASSVYMAGRYSRWPLTLGSVLGLPLKVLWRSFLDLFRRKDTGQPGSFADHIRARYGDNLYRFFFSAYTRKFTGVDAESLHVDWAAAGVNRAVIDRRVKADSLLSLLKGLLLPRPVTTTFYYPAEGGIETFSDLLAKRIEDHGGEVRLGVTVTGLKVEGGSVAGVTLNTGETVEADTVYWSAPVSVLFPQSGLSFINTLVFNVALEHEQDNHYQWCYFGQEDVIFSRLTVPRNFRKDMVPPGCDSLTAEITCGPDHPAWEDPSSLTERVVDDLERVSAIDPSDVIFVDFRRVRETYPLYGLDYRERLESLELPGGLHLLGRCGSFWYNNMDHSIAQALAMASGKTVDRDFWNA
jgi:protoporphyrinogen oxidase